MFDWLRTSNKAATITSVPVVNWPALLGTESPAGVQFTQLPQLLLPVDFINRFVPDRDEASLTEAVLDWVHNYVNALRFPRSIRRLMFAITGCLNQLALLKRTKAGPFEIRTIELHHWSTPMPGRRRQTQLRAFGKRSGIGVLECVSSHVYDTGKPSAVQCVGHLLNEHWTARDNGCLCDAFAVADTPAVATCADAHTGIVRLIHLSLNSMIGVDISRRLIEESEAFSERATPATMDQEIALLREIAQRYAVQIGEPALAASAVFDLLRDLAVHTFAVHDARLQGSVLAHMSVNDSVLPTI